MGKLYEKIEKRNIISSDNQEFQIRTCDDFKDGKLRAYDQKSKIKREREIIQDLKDGKDYRTEENTHVLIGKRNGIEYIYSVKNNTRIDNIENLPTF